MSVGSLIGGGYALWALAETVEVEFLRTLGILIAATGSLLSAWWARQARKEGVRDRRRISRKVDTTTLEVDGMRRSLNAHREAVAKRIKLEDQGAEEAHARRPRPAGPAA